MTQTLDPFDELAAMFLTDPDASGGPATADEPGEATSVQSIAAEAHTIEVLLVGHLPVRGGLWITPYADAVARETGTTALVRLDGDEPMIQVLGSRDEIEARQFNEDLASCRTLREAIERLGAVANWVVRPSAGTDLSELLVPAPVRGVAAERVTILSSGNQAAVVNAYGLVKTLVETARSAGLGVPRIGLAVIGCDEETARQITRKLNQTTREYLEVPVSLVRTVSRIDASERASSLRSFPGQVRPGLEDVRTWIEASRRARPAFAPAPPPSVERPTRRLVELETGPEAPRTPPPIPDAATGEKAAGFRSPWSDDPLAGARVDRTVHLVASELEGKAPEEVREPDDHGRPVPLVTYVPGLVALAARCPDHEHVELGVDAKGVVHLLARVEAVRSLPVVAAWVRRHRELLAMTSPDHAIDPAGRTQPHLFTDAPLNVADLHVTNIALHVLAPVRVEGRTGWYAAPLNTPVMGV